MMRAPRWMSTLLGLRAYYVDDDDTEDHAVGGGAGGDGDSDGDADDDDFDFDSFSEVFDSNNVHSRIF